MKQKRLRVGKYRRVSKKEQVIRGFSLQAQDEALNEHIKERNYVVAGDYVDEGITASTLNRPALQRLLDDVRAGRIDLIIFTKLDRWFRSVSHYYKIQEILEEHSVPWRTVLEDYNTETSDGKFKVNIMLSVAQQELDRTSERIKVVFDSKIKNKQAITKSLPLGYTIGIVGNEKRVVKDESAKDAVFDFFAFFEIHQSLRATMMFINNKYDLHLSYNTCKAMVRNSLYAGVYHDVKEYCEPYISEERFDKIQKILNRNGNVRQNKYTYLFSGLIRCPNCGRSMSGCRAKSNKGGSYVYHYYYYRCGHAYMNMQCKYRTSISETKIEEYLLNNVEEELQNYIVESEISPPIKTKPKYDKAKLKRQLDRLNRQYREERIDDDEYDEEYAILREKLDQCDDEPEKRDLRPLKAFLESDFQDIYKTLSKAEQRAMWRSIISQIIVHDYDNIEIKFL